MRGTLSATFLLFWCLVEHIRHKQKLYIASYLFSYHIWWDWSGPFPGQRISPLWLWWFCLQKYKIKSPEDSICSILPVLGAFQEREKLFYLFSHPWFLDSFLLSSYHQSYKIYRHSRPIWFVLLARWAGSNIALTFIQPLLRFNGLSNPDLLT